MGYLGYDVIREVERLPDVPDDDRHVPDAVMSMIGSLAAFDHWRQRVTLIESVPGPRPRRRRRRRRLRRRRGVASSAAVANLARPLPYVPVEPPVGRRRAARRRRARCPTGCTSRRSRSPRSTSSPATSSRSCWPSATTSQLDADPFDVYRVLRQVNPSPYMYFVRHPELTIVGSSPEPMVQLLDGTVISRPIAGTRKRGRTDEHDRRMAAELTEHPKERAEHVMLVDLARNDVGRVAEFGTVHVDELMTLERYSHVMHLTSQVSGDLRRRARADRRAAGDAAGRHGERGAEGAGDGDHRRARAGASGARTRASSGYVDWSGNLDTAIAIRTMFVARRPGQPAGRRRHRRRLGPRRRGPGVPQQGGRPRWPPSPPPGG